MDKIKELLKQMGASDDLAKQIIESIDSHVTSKQTILENEFKTRLQKAKQVCLEETQRYKADLAKKVQIFFESRSDKIEQQIAKQVAIRESAAESNLIQIKALLEGVQVNANGEADIQAVKDQMLALTKKLQVVSEERNMAVQKANFAHSVAEKALKRNRILESKLTEQTVVENKTTESKVEPKVEPVAEPIAEGKAEPKTPAPVKKQGEQPQTATVVSESTVAKKKDPAPEAAPIKTVKGWDPNSIAAGMDN